MGKEMDKMFKKKSFSVTLTSDTQSINKQPVTNHLVEVCSNKQSSPQPFNQKNCQYDHISYFIFDEQPNSSYDLFLYQLLNLSEFGRDNFPLNELIFSLIQQLKGERS